MQAAGNNLGTVRNLQCHAHGLLLPEPFVVAGTALQLAPRMPCQFVRTSGRCSSTVWGSCCELYLSPLPDAVEQPAPAVEGKQQLPVEGGFACRSCNLVDRGQLGGGQKERLELLRQESFSVSVQYMQDKCSSRHPDFLHQRSSGALWLENQFKPPWVDSQLATWNDQFSDVCHLHDPIPACVRRIPHKRQEVVGQKFIVSCDEGQLREAVEALSILVQQESCVDNSLIYRVLKRCMARKDLALGRRVHALTVQSGFESNAFLANHLICMYASHRRLEDAMQVFNKVAAPDAYMWASIILAHARHGQPIRGIQLYRAVRESNVKPDNRIFLAALKACATAADFSSGKQVHADILHSSVEPDMFVRNSLVDMYAKCGRLMHARDVFDSLLTKNVVTWTTIIAGYVQQGLSEEALSLYATMQQESIIPADHFTFSCLLKACSSVRALQQGKQLHLQIKESGLESNIVISNALVDMYAKCGSLEDARKVFDRTLTKDVVTWTAMIAGYVQHELSQEALSLYTAMEQDGLTPANNVTFVCLLQACASVTALHLGKQLHAQIKQRGLEGDVVVGCCLVDMYVKCGRLEDARKVFDGMRTRDVVTWTALMNGYSQCTDAQEAVNCFKEMQQHGVEPDEATFICLLVACSHEGMVNEGQRYFEMMVQDYGIEPRLSHYNCMVDLFGRSGHLEEAENLLRGMPFNNDSVGWTSLLTACKSHGDVERGRRCFDQLITWDPENATAYVLLGNIYANAGRWSDVMSIESLRKCAGARKKPAKACIEVKSKVHEFTVGEDRADVSLKLRIMNAKLKEEGGHVPQTDLVLKSVSDKEKEDALCGHAEKLALAYGLLNTPDGTTLLVTKNLRMCSDCHSGTKIMSHLEGREIIVRDAHRLHRFIDGSCSCGDRH